MTAPDDAEVDRLAKVACDTDEAAGGHGWADASEGTRDAYRAIVRAVLAAQQQPAPPPGDWRVGQHYGIHIYDVSDGRPVGTMHRAEDAARAVAAVNAEPTP